MSRKNNVELVALTSGLCALRAIGVTKLPFGLLREGAHGTFVEVNAVVFDDVGELIFFIRVRHAVVGRVVKVAFSVAMRTIASNLHPITAVGQTELRCEGVGPTGNV